MQKKKKKKRTHSCNELDSREQTATFTAIPLGFYGKDRKKYTVCSNLRTFSISDTFDLLYYIISLVKHES